VDRRTRRAYVGELPIALTKQSFELLAYLLAEQGRVVPNEELIRAIWEHEIVEDRHFLQTAMYRLRASMKGASLADSIEVVRGVGYSIGRRSADDEARRASVREQRVLEVAIRTGPVPTMLLDRRGTIVIANEAVAAEMGYTASELESMSSFEAFGVPELRERHAKGFAEVLGGETIRSRRTAIRRRDGSLYEGELSARPVILDGEVIGMVIEESRPSASGSLSVAAGARKRLDAVAEAALRASVLPTLIVDAEQRILLASESMARITGYTVEELEALPSAEALSPPVRRIARQIDIGSIMAGESRDGSREPIVRRDGSVIELELFAEPLTVDGELAFVLVQFWVAHGDVETMTEPPESPVTSREAQSN
jgi:PAS domain S-box-containing protein